MERRVCEEQALRQGAAVVFEAWVRGEMRPCFVVATAHGPAAYLNVCAHRNQPVVIDDEPVENGLVECRAHGAFYEPETGECVEGPCVGARLVPVPVRVRDGVVYALDDDAVDDSIYADEG